jgi:hypothetical protein
MYSFLFQFCCLHIETVHGYVPTALRDKKALLDNHWLADQSLSDGRLYRYGLKERK